MTQKVILQRDPKTFTHTRDGKKRKITDTSKAILQQKILSNWNLPVIATTMNSRIDDRIATCGGTSHTLVTPVTEEVIVYTARVSVQVKQTPRRVR